MQFTKEQLTEIIAAANEVITALADENEDLSKSDTTGMIRAWDYLNDDAAPPEVVKRLAEIALAAMQQEPVVPVVQLPAGFTSEQGTLVQLERVMAALAVAGVRYQHRTINIARVEPAPVVPYDVIARIEHEANHVTAWHHMDEHSCKVNRRDLLTLVNACLSPCIRAEDMEGFTMPEIQI